MEKFGRKIKNTMIDEVTFLIKENPYLFFVSLEKMPNLKAEKLRRLLKKSSSNLKVVKRSILKLALKKRSLDSLSGIAENSCAISFTKEDPVRISKILFDFAKTEESLVIRGGYMEGEILAVEKVKELAMLPTREVLLSMVVGRMKAPINGLVFALKGNIQKLVYALNAISSVKSGKE